MINLKKTQVRAMIEINIVQIGLIGVLGTLIAGMYGSLGMVLSGMEKEYKIVYQTQDDKFHNTYMNIGTRGDAEDHRARLIKKHGDFIKKETLEIIVQD